MTLMTSDTSLIGTTDELILSCMSIDSHMPTEMKTVYKKIGITFTEGETKQIDCLDDTINFMTNLQDTTYEI